MIAFIPDEQTLLTVVHGVLSLIPAKIEDGLMIDGLTDVYNNVHMGVCAEICAEEMSITREEQDNFALKSYEKSKTAWKNGFFKNEITEVVIQTRKGEKIINEDEEFKS
jgi:acetyl-CoA C-acetyltransferase